MRSGQRDDSFALEQTISSLSVLVAVYNEVNYLEQSLRSLSLTLSKLGCDTEVIVVESNSTDGSRELILSLQDELGLQVHLQDSPEGKGSAIRLAMNKMSGDVFLIYDADQEYSPEDIPKLLAPIEFGQTSFVLGTRHSAGQSMRVMDAHRFRPFIMNQAHIFFTFMLNLTLGEKMTDPFTMYKVFRSEVFSGIPLRGNRFDLDWELVIKAVLRGSRPLEVPISYKSRSFSEGKKILFFRDPISWFVALIRFGFLKRM